MTTTPDDPLAELAAMAASHRRYAEQLERWGALYQQTIRVMSARADAMEAVIAEVQRLRLTRPPRDDAYDWMESVLEAADRAIHGHLDAVGRGHGKLTCSAYDGVTGIGEELARLRARVAELEGERDRARSAVKEWLRAGRHLKAAQDSGDEGDLFAAEHELRELAIGNAYADAPEPILKLVLDREQALIEERNRLRAAAERDRATIAALVQWRRDVLDFWRETQQAADPDRIGVAWNELDALMDAGLAAANSPASDPSERNDP